MKLYHYTSLFHLPQILEDGYLSVTESNASFSRTHAAPDVVWLTANPSSSKEASLRGSCVDKTQVRIEVDVDAVRYRRWAQKHNVAPEVVRRLNKTGGDQANNWYVTERQVQRESWNRIEIYVPRMEKWIEFYNKNDNDEKSLARAAYWSKSLEQWKEARQKFLNSLRYTNYEQLESA